MFISCKSLSNILQQILAAVSELWMLKYLIACFHDNSSLHVLLCWNGCYKYLLPLFKKNLVSINAKPFHPRLFRFSLPFPFLDIEPKAWRYPNSYFIFVMPSKTQWFQKFAIFQVMDYRQAELHAKLHAKRYAESG